MFAHVYDLVDHTSIIFNYHVVARLEFLGVEHFDMSLIGKNHDDAVRDEVDGIDLCFTYVKAVQLETGFTIVNIQIENLNHCVPRHHHQRHCVLLLGGCKSVAPIKDWH